MTNKILLGKLNNAIEGVGSPLGNETPLFIGQIYVDTTEGQEEAYVSTGLTSNNWKSISMDELGSGGSGGSVGWTEILGKPNFSTVSTSGNYNDLSNKPTIPTIPANIVTDASYVHTDNNYTTNEKNKLSGLSNYSLPKASDTVLGGVKVGSNLSIDENGVLSATVSGDGGTTDYNTLTNKPNLSTVATSGDYNDLINKPTMPTTLPASDVSSWAKQPTKPSYTYTEIGGTKPTYTKSDVGLGNVDNTSDANKPVSTAQQTALNLKEDRANKGLPNGYVGLDENAKISSAYLPSYVDDVLEFTNLVSFPVTGEAGKIYTALDTNKTYRWGGSSYTAIASGSVDSVNGKTGIVTLVKSDIGLSNVDNTSDINKPISTAVQNALNGKLDSTATTNFATSTQGTKADSAVQGVKVNGTTYNPDSTTKVVDLGTIGVSGGGATLTGAKCRFIGHRGVSGLAPENTLPSYELTGKYGFWGGETDILTTSDGEWVVMHDTDIDRMTNGTGNVNALTLATIKSKVIDSGNNIALYPNLRVPTFEEYLVCCKKNNVVPVTEIKQGGSSTTWDSLMAIIKKHGMEDKILIISFDVSALQEIRNRSTKIKMQYLSFTLDTTVINQAIALGCTGVGIQYSVVTKALVEQVHTNGLEINCWAVDDFQIIKTLIGYDVDYISTNIVGGVI